MASEWDDKKGETRYILDLCVTEWSERARKQEIDVDGRRARKGKGERQEKWGKARRGFRRDATRVPRAQLKGCLEGKRRSCSPAAQGV